AIVREEITMIYLPPGLLKEVNSQLAGQSGRVRLNKMLVGVEPIRDEVLETYVRLNPKMRIINGYGPTETTICATSVNYVSHEPEGEIVPIGLPLSNNQVVLLDAAGHVVPQGIPGEICISGGGVSRGYLDNPEMTAEKYVAHPYFKGKRMYRTGDLGRIIPGFKGSETQGAYMIKFQGRVDHQVKIRGYRIEPGEIEKRLLKHRQIKEALVLTLGDEKGGKYLCAYFVPGDTAMETREVREYLAGDLPEYMIPSYFVRLDKIPLTPNGKVDRNALPAPETGIDRENYVAPRDAVEMKLVGLWADVLKIDKDIIGIDANFFELGGHSLRANVLVTRIEKEFQVKIPLAEIFVTPFVRGLAERIRSTVKEQLHPVEIAEKKQYYQVSSAQERLYVLQQMDARGIVYNMPSMLIVEGEIDKEKLENIFYRLLKRHESLRTSFLMLESRPVQRVYGEVGFKIEYYNAAADEHGQTRTLIKVFGSPETFFQKGFWPPEAIIKSFIQPFDLSQAPLLRVGLMEIEERRHILIVDMHHIISDGVSLDIFTREFVALYAGMELPPLKIQYKDYCEWQAWVTRGQDMETHRQYWLNQFQGKIPALNLPMDFARPAAPTFEGGLEQFEINAAVTKALNQLALEEGATLYMVLTAALVILLSRITGQEDIVIGTVSAGRDHPDLQGVVGMFVNTLALRSYPSGRKTFREFLQEMKSCVLESFAHQDYPFEELVEQLNGPGNTRQNSLFDVMFSLNNMELEIPKIPGLKLTPYKYDQGSAKFDLTIMVFTGESLVVNIEYRSKLFKKERIEWFAGYFEDIVAMVSENKETRLEEISITHGLLAAKEIELEKTFNF
ncbi:MAG: hypothetical protein QG657_3122, partial [Acidobacteriota bacterium]|nr:hypothetical protein [Acidobacteriota bacterium]